MSFDFEPQLAAFKRLAALAADSSSSSDSSFSNALDKGNWNLIVFLTSVIEGGSLFHKVEEAVRASTSTPSLCMARKDRM
jgi:hypothetical protein